MLKIDAMNTDGIRGAIYLRVSRDDQTTENQRLVLERVAQHRGWAIVQTYQDQGIGGAKGRVSWCRKLSEKCPFARLLPFIIGISARLIPNIAAISGIH
jgi:hypothetical protein